MKASPPSMALPQDNAAPARLIEAALPGLAGEIGVVLRLLQGFRAAAPHRALVARGLVLEGPSGVGKTTLAKELARHGDMPAHSVSCPSLFGTDRGDAERNVEGAFRACAAKDGSSLLILDEVDVIGKDRTRAKHVTDLGVLAMLLECFDRPEYASVFVLAIAVDASLLDASLLQPGRLEVTLSLGAPTLQKRHIILDALLQRLGTTVESGTTPQVLESLTRRTRGFTGADLSRLCTEALGAALRRSKGNNEEKKGTPVSIHNVDWDTAFDNARPVDIPWSSPEGGQLADLVGVDDVVRTVTEAVLLPLARPEALVAMGVPRASFGVLLHGPTGTGKSTLGLALAAAARPYASFLAVECPELVNKVVGESERAVARLFQTARQAAPCILFLDHIEAFAGRRGFDSSSEQTMDRLLSTLLVEMDGLTSGGGGGDEMIVVVGATNHLSLLDEAILRPGRLDVHMEMALPDPAARTAIFQHYLGRLPLRYGMEEEMEDEAVFSDVSALAHTLAEESEGLSGADIQGVCQEAALLGLREDLERRHLRPRHVLQAARALPPQQPGEDGGTGGGV